MFHNTIIILRRFGVSLAISGLSLLFRLEARAEFNGTALNEQGRGMHAAVGALIWQNGPHLIGPCTGVLVCNNVVLTTTHCINFNPAGQMYFTLLEDINELPGGANTSQYQKVDTEFRRVGQTKTRRIDRASVAYGPHARIQLRRNEPAGIAMVKLAAGETLSPASFPNLVAQEFVPTAQANVFGDAPAERLLRPGAGATQFFVSGYGFNSRQGDPAILTGSGVLRSGTMRFLTWLRAPSGEPMGAEAPQSNAAPAGGQPIPGFLLELSRGADGTVSACPGDSGGPMFARIAEESYRLAGIRDFASNQGCEAGDLPAVPAEGNLPGLPPVPHFDDFTSLIYTPNRVFIRDYMRANCADNRVIDSASGNNEVQQRGCLDDQNGNEFCNFENPPSDIDGDGVTDSLDLCPDDMNKSVAGICGCGVSDGDTDSDGVPDCQDECRSDGRKTLPGPCGCGFQESTNPEDGSLVCVTLLNLEVAG